MSGSTPSGWASSDRFFYGWVIVVVGALIAFSSGPGQSFVFSIFIDSIMEETGFSRSTISGLCMLSTGLSAALVAIVSRMADRVGRRIMVVIVGVGFAGACFRMASAAGVVAFYLSFASLRALGQGALTINATLLVNQWFVVRRGRAIALGYPLSNAILPPLSRFLIDEFGWREAYGTLGVIVLLLVVPAALIFVRNRPEDVGLYPDGYSQPPEIERTLTSTDPHDDQRRVLSSPSFWLLALPLATPGLVTTTLIFPQTSIFEERGLSATIAATVFIVFAIASAPTSMVAGFVVERTGPKRLFIFSMVALLVVLAMSMVVTSPWIAVINVATMGVASGSQRIVHGVTWAYYYGRVGLGRVHGSAMMVTITGAAIGPFPLALFHDLTGDYNAGIIAMALLPVLSIAAVVFGHPERVLEKVNDPRPV
ncbi:MAG TPA: MFS transporter [Dehalococcoidia bacterium]|nr:MFS transporter [Dehalococcoidia bacterium]